MINNSTNTRSARIYVTGATGFLGGRAARRLHDLGYEVTGVGRSRILGAGLERDGVRFIPIDLTSASRVSDTFKGATHVVHCAALASPWGRYAQFFRANVLATRAVIAACEKNHVERLVHISTPSVYVGKVDRLDIREDEPLPEHPINHYAATKLLAEQEVDGAYKRGLATITLRPQMILGDGDTTLFPRLLRIARSGRLPVIGNASNIVDITYIDNAVDAIVRALHAPSRAVGRKYNITNGESRSFYAMIDEVLRGAGVAYRPRHIPFHLAYAAAIAIEATYSTGMLSGEPSLTRYTTCLLAKSRTLDITAAREELGYSPAVSLNDTISRLIRTSTKTVSGQIN